MVGKYKKCTANDWAKRDIWKYFLNPHDTKTKQIGRMISVDNQ